MGALTDLYIKKETVKKILEVLEKGGGNEGKGIALTISINDDSNEWGQNVSAHVSQSKEQREAKKAKFYVGNGKVFWTDGTIKKAEKKEEQGIQAGDKQGNSSEEEEDDDLPF